MFVIDWIRISGDSMFPTLHNGETVLAEKISANSLSYGDIIIVRYPNAKQCVKRVIGTDGDTIEISNGTVYLNGEVLNEPYLAEQMFGYMDKITVPENSVYVMGDNRNHSLDSRDPFVGAIPKENIVGKVFCVVFPLKQVRSVPYV